MTLTNLLRYISFKHIRLQKTRTIIAVLSICLGVASLVSIDIVNTSVLRSFEDSVSRITGRAALQVTEADSGFPESMLEKVQSVPGVEYAVPLIETDARLAQGSERSFMVLGVDILQDGKIRNYSALDDSAEIPDLLLYLAKPGSILLTKEMADRENIRINQNIRVQTVQGIKTLTVSGLLNPTGPAKAAGGDIAVMDVYAAQMVFGKDKKIDRIDVSLLPGYDRDTVRERIRSVLPEGYTVDTPSARTRQMETITLRFRKSLGMMSFMALLVGMYLIYNAVTISVVQRRKEIGILRGLGATRKDIIGLFLLETALIAAFGSLLGIGFGILFAKAAIGAVAQNMTEIWVKTPVTELAINGSDLLKDWSIGIIASLVVAAFPAWSSSRNSPIAAIRALPYDWDGRLSTTMLNRASVLSLLSAVLVYGIYKVSGASPVLDSYSSAVFSNILLMFSGSLAMPSLLKRFLLLYHRTISSRLGAGGKLAGLNVEKNIGRNAVAAAAILYSISFFICSVNMLHSAKKSAIENLESMIRVDLLITSGNPMISPGATGSILMPEHMWKEIEQVPGVLSVESYHKTRIPYNGKRVYLEIFDIARRFEYTPGMFAQGSRDDVIRLMPNQDTIAVNEAFAARNRVKPGDSVVLPTPSGPTRFGVAAIIVAYTSDSGVIWMDSHTYQRHWKDHLADLFEARLQKSADISSVAESIIERFGKDRKLFVLPLSFFREEVKRLLNQSMEAMQAINIVTLIIASFGVVITLLASVLERTREIGILRSIGMRRSQVSALVVIESALLGVVAGFLGVLGGIITGWISLDGLWRADVGASFSYYIHYPTLIGALLLSTGLAALAGLYPAWRAAKTNVVEVLAYE